MSEFLEIPQFVVSPPNFEVIQQGLALINSEEALLPQIAGLSPYQQAELLEQWYAIHDPTYITLDEYDDLFMSMNVEDLKRYASQGVQDIYDSIGASDAAKEWIVEGGKVTGTGAAVAGEKIAYDYATSLAADAAGSTSAMSVLSMNLPTAAAAMAPLLGFALGWTLYEAAPEFWTKISRALLPFCYEDTELMPVMADDNGNTYFPKGAVEAMKEVFDSSGELVSGKSGLWRSNLSPPVEGSYPVSQVTSAGVIISNISQGSVITRTYGVTRAEGEVYASLWDGLLVFSSLSWFKMTSNNLEYDNTSTVNANGTTVYYDYVNISDIVTWSNITRFQGSIPYYTANAKTNAVNNVIGTYSTLNIPGVSEWSGSPYPSSVNEVEILGPVDPNKEGYDKIPYIPISTPIRPGETVNPNTTPDLTKNPDPETSNSPWITPSPNPSTYPPGTEQEKPKPAPLPTINPNPTEVTNPLENPSTKPETKPQPSPNTSTPTDSGTSYAPQNPSSIPFLPGEGLVHVYNPTPGELRAFGKWLWTTFSGDIIETVSKLFNNPMDALIGLHELYVSPNIAGSDNIKAGYLTSDVSSKYVGNRYSTLNCGSIVVPEFYNNYLDYSPYTKCFIYLPFIGIVPVHADDIIGNAVNISYNIDAYTGSCIAAVNVAREGYSSVVYQFQGNCASELPITAGYHSALMAGMLGIAGTAISGNPHVGLSAANLGRANLGKNEVSHSGSFGSAYGAMGAKNPYIIVKRPTQRYVTNYNEDYGFPAHKRVVIGSCTGYLRAREVHVISPTATDDEKARIEELLKEGVFVE